MFGYSDVKGISWLIRSGVCLRKDLLCCSIEAVEDFHNCEHA